MDEATSRTARRANWKIILDATTSLVMIGAAGFVVWSHIERRPATLGPRVPEAPVSLVDVAAKGSANAPLVLMVFGDFQCPFCGRFAREVLPELDAEYIKKGHVQFVYRHLPLPSHQHAVTAAQAAECAGQEGRFWPMHDELFREGAILDDDGVRVIAASLKLNPLSFAQCMHDPSRMSRVVRDRDEAKALGVTATPSFLLGTRLPDGRVQMKKALSGTLSVSRFRSELESVRNEPRQSWIWTRWFFLS